MTCMCVVFVSVAVDLGGWVWMGGQAWVDLGGCVWVDVCGWVRLGVRFVGCGCGCGLG